MGVAEGALVGSLVGMYVYPDTVGALVTGEDEGAVVVGLGVGHTVA